MPNVLRLLNEWRDSVSYAVIPAVCSVVRPTWFEAAMYVVMFVVLREQIRWFGWATWRAPIVVGGQSMNNRRDCATAAIAIACCAAAVLAGPQVVEGSTLSSALAIINLTGAAMSIFTVGGVHMVHQYYRDHMWDWPRKRDGGGGETKKLVDAISSLSVQPQGASA